MDVRGDAFMAKLSKLYWLGNGSGSIVRSSKSFQHSAASISFISQEQAGCQIGCDSGVLILDKVKCS